MRRHGDGRSPRRIPHGADRLPRYIPRKTGCSSQRVPTGRADRLVPRPLDSRRQSAYNGAIDNKEDF